MVAMILAMVGLVLTVLWTIGISGIFAPSIVELRKRKNKRDSSDEKSLATGSSQSDDAISDDAEVDTRPKPKRKKEDVESSNTTKKSRKSVTVSGPHHCRFCGAEFELSQALGGHMNKHRMEKDREAMNRAEELLAKNQQQFMVGNLWTMQGGGMGGNPYYGGQALLPNPPGPGLGTSSRPFYNLPNQSASTLQNSQLHHLAAQQNGQAAIHSLQGGGYYNPMDNSRTQYGTPSQRNVIPPGQFQGQHPVQTVYSDAKGTVLHSGTDTMQPHGQSVFHSNQGGVSDTLQDILNMPTLSSNRYQQAQSNISLPSDSYIRQAAHERQINIMQFVDQHGNPVTDFQGGHSSQMPQDYTQTSLDQKPCTSVRSLGNEPASIKIEHGLYEPTS